MQATVQADDWVTYKGKGGSGQGKHIVLLSGDEEYRSEEAMPQLAKILSQRHGFTCTVLFSVDANGFIAPSAGDSLTHAEALGTADAIVMSLRYRHWNADAMQRFEGALNRGVPIIALRTSTHAFNGFPKGSPWEKWNCSNKGGFGKQVLGEAWVAHWGRHKQEATRGIVEAPARNEVILRGVADIFGTTDVYEAAPPADATILIRGQVLKGMLSTDAPADYKKRTAAKVEQGVNDPMMPVVWTREYKNEAGTV
ncbi:MAG: heme-binding protein, partial [Kiritimatiellaeota bacterium]|nr:heme-binding protein [Kiritimatiellota bacterium]